MSPMLARMQRLDRVLSDAMCVVPMRASQAQHQFLSLFWLYCSTIPVMSLRGQQAVALRERLEQG